MNAKITKKIVVLATGGTIAGLALDVSAPQNYQAAAVSVGELVAGLSSEACEIVSEDVSQIDSKDMSLEVWQALLGRVAHWLDDDAVQGVVVTHGTDTLEETAYFLETVLRPTKPVALTCAMLPANAPDADGPANLRQALQWVESSASHGVCVVCAGEVHPGQGVQKSHSQLRNPFTSRSTTTHPKALQVPSVAQVLACQQWPRVDVVMNHTDVDGRMVRATMLLDAPGGWVVAGTGNGTLHHALEASLLEAQKQGVQVLRASRCALGGVTSRAKDTLPHADGLSVVQARVALVLHLIAHQSA